jgi:hypothetical protein
MALIHAALLFVSVCVVFSLAAASLGSLILRVLQLEMNADGEHLLICTGVGALGIFYSSGLPRFLLPVFPLAWPALRRGSTSPSRMVGNLTDRFVLGLVILLWTFGGAGLVMYMWKPATAALGFVGEVHYLEERRPEYQEAEAINRVMAGQTKGGKTLLFLRHMYSVDVPYLNGDPATSWMINPDHLHTPHDWEVFFQKEGIAFVARSPDYPEKIEAPLTEMEAKGDLVPVAQSVVQDFQGKRIEGKRAEISVIILRVKSSIETKTQEDH